MGNQDNIEQFRTLAIMFQTFYDCFVSNGKSEQIALVLATEIMKILLSQTNADNNDFNIEYNDNLLN